MTNRERILKTNEYDLLTNIQKCLLESECRCILDLLSAKYVHCENESCNECIRKWLNREESEQMANIRLIDANSLQKKLENWLIEMREDLDKGYCTKEEIEVVECCLAEIESAPTFLREENQNEI